VAKISSLITIFILGSSLSVHANNSGAPCSERGSGALIAENNIPTQYFTHGMGPTEGTALIIDKNGNLIVGGHISFYRGMSGYSEIPLIQSVSTDSLKIVKATNLFMSDDSKYGWGHQTVHSLKLDSQNKDLLAQIQSVLNFSSKIFKFTDNTTPTDATKIAESSYGEATSDKEVIARYNETKKDSKNIRMPFAKYNSKNEVTQYFDVPSELEDADSLHSVGFKVLSDDSVLSVVFAYKGGGGKDENFIVKHSKDGKLISIQKLSKKSESGADIVGVSKVIIDAKGNIYLLYELEFDYGTEIVKYNSDSQLQWKNNSFLSKAIGNYMDGHIPFILNIGTLITINSVSVSDEGAIAVIGETYTPGPSPYDYSYGSVSEIFYTVINDQTGELKYIKKDLKEKINASLIHKGYLYMTGKAKGSDLYISKRCL
jgi:hypothetical protein